MPGRRYPRRSQDETISSHVRSVFRGGLDGASNIPYPVNVRKDQNANGGECLETLFFQEEFTVGLSSYIALTRLPLPHSEHVYLCRAGSSYGTYQREGVTWARDSGSRTINVLSAMGAQTGDVLVVEYAYYDQTPSPAAPLNQILWTMDERPAVRLYHNDIVRNSGSFGSAGNGKVSPKYSDSAPDLGQGFYPAPSLAPGSVSALYAQGMPSWPNKSMYIYTDLPADPQVCAAKYELDFWVKIDSLNPSATPLPRAVYLGTVATTSYYLSEIFSLFAVSSGSSNPSDPARIVLVRQYPGFQQILNIPCSTFGGPPLHIVASILVPNWGVRQPTICDFSLSVNGEVVQTSTSASFTSIPSDDGLYISTASTDEDQPHGFIVDEFYVRWSGEYVQ